MNKIIMCCFLFMFALNCNANCFVKRIDLSFWYDSTEQGTIDKNNFISLCKNELLNSSVVPYIIYKNGVDNSKIEVFGNLVNFTILYKNSEEGISEFISFWNTLEIEFESISLIKIGLKGSTCSNHDCYHEEMIPCKNFVRL